MHIGQPFKIFQDRNDLEWGQNWASRIDDSLNTVTFLIPVITPSFFQSPACRKEFDDFHKREQALGTTRLILPIYYLNSDEIEDESSDEIASVLKTRQWSDWRALRFFDLKGPEVSAHLASQAIMIKNAQKELDNVFSDAPSSSLDAILEVRRVGSDQSRIQIQDGTIGPSLSAKPKAVRRKRQKISVSGDASSYQAYTRKYDEIIKSSELLTAEQTIELGQQAVRYSEDLSSAHAYYLKSLESQVALVESGAITILVDNSGSLRGKKISATAAWSIILVEVLDRAGWKTELLGFTTRSWKGGRSREDWLAEGRPASPGRLAELRHIVYKSYDESTVGFAQSTGLMLKEGILKENIDGEAILWAASRITDVQASRKIILVVSDGAPVDDSTLSVNPSYYLEHHLNTVLSDLGGGDIKVIAVGVEHDVQRYYGADSVAVTIDNLGVEALKLIVKITNDETN